MFLCSLFKQYEATQGDKGVVKCEIKDMLNMDIPYFYLNTSGKSLFGSEGEKIEDYFEYTSLEHLKKKIVLLDEDDLKRQLMFMNIILTEINEFQVEDKKIELQQMKMIPHREKNKAHLLKAVQKLADSLIKTAVFNKDRTEVNWIGVTLIGNEDDCSWDIRPLGTYLYEGMSGLAIFFNALYAVDPQKEYLIIRNAIVFCIAICDDDIQITGKIERLLQDIAKRNFVDTEIEVFWNGKSLADAIAAGERYDVIYLDIEMDKEDGISAARRIRTYDKNVRIIYVTSHESYMRESFEVRPFQFLVKPVTDKIMEKCFKSVYEDINSEDFYFRYSYQRMNHKVPIKDILYFESNKRKIFIVTEQEILELYGKLNEIEETLKTCKISFLRVHQSFLVNYKHISGQSYDSVVMDNGQKISISEDRRKIISEQYCSMEDTFYVDE